MRVSCKIRNKNGWKRWAALAVSAALIFPASMAFAAETDMTVIDESRAVDADGFEIEDGVLKKYTGTATDVVIPDGVESIGKDAFSKCGNLISIEIPETVTRIEEFAFSECSKLTSMVIPENVTYIGNYAFWECRNLTSVTMSDNVKFIGESAFSCCSSLMDITIPNGIETIGTCVFIGCSSLKNIIIPESVETIMDYAFEDCTGLTSITIPRNATDVGNRAFAGCSNLANITVDSGNISYTSQNGLLYNKSMTESIICPEGKVGTVVIPNGVTSIRDRVFYNCNSVTDIEIPESVEEIEDTSFPGCGSLENIGVDENNAVYFSQEGALYENDEYGTVSIVKCPEKKTGKFTVSEKANSIGTVAFYGCALLTDIVIPNKVKSIGNKAFDGCSGLTSITIPKSVRRIGSEESYSNNTPLFDGCSNLESINVESDNSVYASKDGILYAKFVNEEDDRYYSTYLCRCPEGKAGKIKIPESVEHVTEIGNIRTGAFSNCTKLTSIEISTEIGFIGNKVFSNCNVLSSVIIPKNVYSISKDAFTGCRGDLSLMVVKESYAETYAKENNIKYKYIEGFLYKEVENDTLLITLYSGNDVDIVIPAEIEGKRVAGVDSRVFQGCDNLKSITFSEGITEIGNEAFKSCAGLCKVKLPNSLKKIGDSAFEDCKSLNSIKIPKGVADIGLDAFYDCGENLILIVDKGSYAEDYAQDLRFDYSYVEGNEGGENSFCPHTWNTFVTKAAIKKNGTITKTCAKCGGKTTTIIYAPTTINLSKSSFTYNNKNQKPSVSIKDSKGKALKNNTDYTVSYPKNIKNIGQYTVTINFKGNYSGMVKKTFIIVPKGASILKITPKKKGFTVKWKKQATQTTGYEVAYSTDSKFSKKNTKIVPIKKNGTTSKSIGKLKAKKKYYVRIRTYKTIKGKKYYSGWSKVKNVTVKK